MLVVGAGNQGARASLRSSHCRGCDYGAVAGNAIEGRNNPGDYAQANRISV